ncbi:MAG: phenylacetate-CoA oxygenase subunit PaaC [Planctomycetota bacterium]|nr:phenylacetate-CoA oxygenase subunit PaaC [Planctomycetota bacterium]
MAVALSETELTGDRRSAIIDLLYRLADDSLIIGHRESEWTGLGPILEEDIAFSSMAQDKMGHALAFYTLLHELAEPNPNQLAFLRSASEFRCCAFVALESFADGQQSPPESLFNNPVRDRLVSQGDWALSCTRQFLFSEADAVRMAALETSSYEPLAQLARKFRGELKYHTMHGRMLIERLGAATEESRRRMSASVDTLFPYALGMFETTKWDKLLEAEGLAPAECTLCERWLEEVGPRLRAAGLEIPKNAEPVCGGRIGRHPAQLARLVDDIQQVRRLDPAASW